MTDTTASSTSPQPHGDDRLSSPADVSGKTSAPSGGEWNTVSFPGQLPVIDTPPVEVSEPVDPAIMAAATGNQVTPADEVASPSPEIENVLQIIQDLNHCNDALLRRVAELEEALERSQVALQAEIERHQAAPGALPLTAAPGPVQQQIAQLLSELEIANDGLRRTTIHNETLQAELDVNRQRVAQLERECTLLQQRFSEKTTALHQAEETCRDLKARLHRQQRYTLQFKAALEKCLNMSAGPTEAEPDPAIAQGQLTLGSLQIPMMDEAGQAIGLPRSQQIQPWSAGTVNPTDSPDLTQLLRGLQRASTGVAPATAIAQTQPAIQPIPARVTEPAIAAQPDPMPRLPEALLAPGELPEVASAPVDPWLEEETTATLDSQAAVFTEPSPWGEPIAPVAAAPAPPPVPAAMAEPIAAPAIPAPAPDPVPTARAIPAPPAPAPTPSPLPAYLTAGTQVSPSPLVYPLRSQKKIKSIAAVELPSFGRNPRRR